MTPLNVFIGYDPRQPVAFQVASHSLWEQASCPVSITRLCLRQLPITRTGLTEFTYSRFLVPFLSGFHGVSIFLDSDVLVRGDVAELLAHPLAYPKKTVFVSQNKLRFEWPSVMVFNNQNCQVLTPKYVDDKRNPVFNFTWAAEVGHLPPEWNHLVGYDAPNQNAKLVHFTQGIPIWTETQGCEYAEQWQSVAQRCMSSVSFQELMGKSVHIKPMQEKAKHADVPILL